MEISQKDAINQDIMDRMTEALRRSFRDMVYAQFMELYYEEECFYDEDEEFHVT